MKITKISVHQIDVPIKPATISHDRVMSVFDETIVRTETDADIRPSAHGALTTAAGGISTSHGPPIRWSCRLNANAAESPRAFRRPPRVTPPVPSCKS